MTHRPQAFGIKAMRRARWLRTEATRRWSLFGSAGAKAQHEGSGGGLAAEANFLGNTTYQLTPT